MNEDLVPGLKRNEHKTMLTLVPPEMIEELAKVFEYGLQKYERDSWRNFTPEQAVSCLPDAALRHFYAWMKGEIYDQESGLPHLLSAAWNILVVDFHTRDKI